MTPLERKIGWIFFACRVVVGLLVCYAGLELVRGNSLLTGSGFDSLTTGLFVMLLGCYVILASLWNVVHGNGPEPS